MVARQVAVRNNYFQLCGIAIEMPPPLAQSFGRPDLLLLTSEGGRFDRIDF
jgi:hypothetical protein